MRDFKLLPERGHSLHSTWEKELRHLFVTTIVDGAPARRLGELFRERFIEGFRVSLSDDDRSMAVLREINVLPVVGDTGVRNSPSACLPPTPPPVVVVVVVVHLGDRGHAFQSSIKSFCRASIRA